jgi:aspartate 1-decarboxylase
MLKAKIHRARITGCDLNYEGSISIDSKLLSQAGILQFEQVDVYNVNNGERLTTYAIEGEAGSGEIALNGAAARKAITGDEVIICSYCAIPEEKAPEHNPVILLMDRGNSVVSSSGN